MFTVVIIGRLFKKLKRGFVGPTLKTHYFLLVYFTKGVACFICSKIAKPAPLTRLGTKRAIGALSVLLKGVEKAVKRASMITVVVNTVFLVLVNMVSLEVPKACVIAFIVFVALFKKRKFSPRCVATRLYNNNLVLKT